MGLEREVTTRMQGIDLMPVARGERTLRQRSICGAIYPNDAVELGKPAQHVRGRWIRDGDYKLIVPGPAKIPLSLSLYDLANDPLEKIDLASRPEQAERIQSLKRKLDHWWPVNDDRVTQRPTAR